jgi:hypothetical protein
MENLINNSSVYFNQKYIERDFLTVNIKIQFIYLYNKEFSFFN